MAPSSGAGIFASEPPNLPTPVRAADTITTSVISISSGTAAACVTSAAKRRQFKDAPRPFLLPVPDVALAPCRGLAGTTHIASGINTHTAQALLALLYI